MKMQTIDNPELELAQNLVEKTGTSIFLTGKAGTGKTTFLRQLMEELPKRMVVLAPTGIAAINAGGMTIHSFFQLPLAPFVPGMAFKGQAKYRYRYSKEKVNIMRSLDLLVIDEVSMVRADLLDAIDDVMRRYKDHNKPFGGAQLLLIGDIHQLPPVVKDSEWELLSQYYDSPYFFSSLALKKTDCCTIELQKVYRQSDTTFLRLLNSIRENKCTPADLSLLNTRYLPGFDADSSEGFIQLTTHNHRAQQINDRKLHELNSKSVRFQAEVTGNFPEMSYPTDTDLELRAGAQVMFIKNDISGQHRYANGTLGKVTLLTSKGVQVRIDETNELVDVQQEVWTNAKYQLNEQTKEIEEVVEGEFTQYPLKLAWAITVHKSQGLTFDKAIIDVSSAFAHGQTYVALSRCRTLEGIVLSAPIAAKALISDEMVDHFIQTSNEQKPDRKRCEAMKQAYFLDLLNELFGFQKIRALLSVYVRMLDEFFYDTYPVLLKKYQQEQERINRELVTVSEKFKGQYYRMVATSEHYHDDAALQERIHSAATYFFEHMQPLINLRVMPHPNADSKTVEKKFSLAADNLWHDVLLKLNLMVYVRDHGFEVSQFLRRKAVLCIHEDEKPKRKASLADLMNGRKKAQRTSPKDYSATTSSAANDTPPSSPAANISDMSDIKNLRLFTALKQWRSNMAKEKKCPAYMVLQQKALIGIANHEPQTLKELAQIAYVGKTTLEKYGEELLEIVRDNHFAGE